MFLSVFTEFWLKGFGQKLGFKVLLSSYGQILMKILENVSNETRNILGFGSDLRHCLDPRIF